MKESMSLPSGNLSPGSRGMGGGDRTGDQWRERPVTKHLTHSSSFASQYKPVT